MIERAKAVLEELFPVRGPVVSLERGEAAYDMKDWVDATAGLRVVLRLIVLDAEGGSIRDIKEQMVSIVPPQAGEVPDERLEAYLRGWLAAVHEVLSKASVSSLETLMPHDLTSPKVLALKKAKTSDDFRDALLARSRLGKLIPE